jgi:hypothetical protein
MRRITQRLLDSATCAARLLGLLSRDRLPHRLPACRSIRGCARKLESRSELIGDGQSCSLQWTARLNELRQPRQNTARPYACKRAVRSCMRVCCEARCIDGILEIVRARNARWPSLVFQPIGRASHPDKLRPRTWHLEYDFVARFLHCRRRVHAVPILSTTSRRTMQSPFLSRRSVEILVFIHQHKPTIPSYVILVTSFRCVCFKRTYEKKHLGTDVSTVHKTHAGAQC